jgi:hypothetical protein
MGGGDGRGNIVGVQVLAHGWRSWCAASGRRNSGNSWRWKICRRGNSRIGIRRRWIIHRVCLIQNDVLRARSSRVTAVEPLEHLVSSTRNVGKRNPSVLILRGTVEANKIFVSPTSLVSVEDGGYLSRRIVV